MVRLAAKRWKIALSIAVSSALGAGGCSEGESAQPTSSSASGTTSTSASASSSGTGGAASSGGTDSGPSIHVALQFEGRVGAEVFSCAKAYKGLGTAMSEVSISDFRLYVHDVRLHQKGGSDSQVKLDQDGLWQYQDLALLDFEDKSKSCANGTVETNGTIQGKVPEGEYDGISFKLGVPFALNHGDAAVAPSPLNLGGLFWNWNFGYKFLRIDSVAVGATDAFNLHVGSTGCQGDFSDGGVSACTRPNVAEITLTGFDPTKSRVIVDYARVIAASDLSVNKDGAPGCMAGELDPECGPIFQRLGLDVADGSLHPDKQELFHVE